MLRYTIRLFGPEEQPVLLSGTLLAAFFASLDTATKGAVRLRLDGRSFARGTQPAWLSRASFYRLEGVDTNNSTFQLSAPSLEETVAAKTPQYELIASDDSHKTGLTLFAESLRDALSGTPHADTYDAPLLKAFQRFEGVFNAGVVGVELRNSNPVSPKIEFVPQDLKAFTALRPKKFEPRYVKIAGKLEMIRFSDSAFALQLANGTIVRGIFASGAPHPLDEFFGKPVVVSGAALFRPSGSLLRIDAEQVDLANEADQVLWAAIPRSEDPLLGPRGPLEFSKAGPGVADPFGRWPRELSEEDAGEFVTLLSEVR